MDSLCPNRGHYSPRSLISEGVIRSYQVPADTAGIGRETRLMALEVVEDRPAWSLAEDDDALCDCSPGKTWSSVARRHCGC